VTAPVVTLSGGQRQSVAVARAVAYASKIIFMDEPTAALGVVQRERVLDNKGVKIADPHTAARTQERR
jgi:simple sugar transport system ATP-binding protein